MTLQEKLKAFMGKYVGVQAVKAGQVVQMGGVVEEMNGEIVFHKERRIIEEMIMTQMGPAPMKKAIPDTVTYIGNIDADDVIFMEVASESAAEAEKLLEGGGPRIQTPNSGAGFLPR